MVRLASSILVWNSENIKDTIAAHDDGLFNKRTGKL